MNMATWWMQPAKRTGTSLVSPARVPGKGQLGDLGQVIERLWTFYDAMRRGTPVPHADKSLSEMRLALRRISNRQTTLD
jgi:hypothetical protein